MLDNLGDEKVLATEMPFEVEIDLPNGEKRILAGTFDAASLSSS